MYIIVHHITPYHTFKPSLHFKLCMPFLSNKFANKLLIPDHEINEINEINELFEINESNGPRNDESHEGMEAMRAMKAMKAIRAKYVFLHSV